MNVESPADPEQSRGRWSESAGIVFACAMVLSALYVGAVGTTHFLEHGFVAASRDVAWMAPLSASFFCLVLLAPVILTAPRFSSARAREIALFGGTFLVVFAVLLPWTQVHRLAAALLAGGIASLAARTLSAAPRSTRLRHVGAILAGAHVVLALVVAGTMGWQSRRAYAALPPLSDGAPNVLLIILDTVRASALGAYGYTRQTTPNIDAFAAGGTLFEHATSTAPWTLPSHGSIFTGQYAGTLSTSFRAPLDGRDPTLAEAFRDAGYETAGFTGNLHYTAWDSGLGRGFIRYTDFDRSPMQILRSGWIGQSGFMLRLLRARAPWQFGQIAREPELLVKPKPGGEFRKANDMADAVLAWQASRGTRPFFAFVNFFDAHEDYTPPRELRTHFAAKPVARDLYDAEVFFIDQQLGRMLGDLGRRGALKNTLVVITADHGEHFGEHKLTGHGNSLYQQLIAVPLVMRFDGRLPAGRTADVVSLRDLAATILDVAGVTPKTPMPGRSLATLWQSDSTRTGDHSAAISELTQDELVDQRGDLQRSQMMSLVDGDHHFIRRNKRGFEELYDIGKDRDETTDVIKAAGGKLTADSLRERLRALVAADRRPPRR